MINGTVNLGYIYNHTFYINPLTFATLLQGYINLNNYNIKSCRQNVTLRAPSWDHTQPQ